jgi:hypothetical protein
MCRLLMGRQLNGFPISHSYTICPRKYDHFAFIFTLRYTCSTRRVNACSYFCHILIAMMQLIEGTHYRRRENQPSPAPHKSKEAVDCLLWCDPGDDDVEEIVNVPKKRSRPVGFNIRLDRFHKHLHSHHPDACRNGARSLLTMGSTQRANGISDNEPEAHAPSIPGRDPHIEASEMLLFVFLTEGGIMKSSI